MSGLLCTAHRTARTNCFLPRRTTATLALALGFVTVVLFMYILFMPMVKGEKPNVRPPPQFSFCKHSAPQLIDGTVPALATIRCAVLRHSGTHCLVALPACIPRRLIVYLLVRC